MYFFVFKGKIVTWVISLLSYLSATHFSFLLFLLLLLFLVSLLHCRRLKWLKRSLAYQPCWTQKTWCPWKCLTGSASSHMCLSTTTSSITSLKVCALDSIVDIKYFPGSSSPKHFTYKQVNHNIKTTNVLSQCSVGFFWETRVLAFM